MIKSHLKCVTIFILDISWSFIVCSISTLYQMITTIVWSQNYILIWYALNGPNNPKKTKKLRTQVVTLFNMTSQQSMKWLIFSLINILKSSQKNFKKSDLPHENQCTQGDESHFHILWIKPLHRCPTINKT